MRTWSFILLSIVLAGCETSDYEGYKRLEASVHYKLHMVGDEHRTVGDASYITLNVKAFAEDGSALARKKMQRVSFSKALLPRAIRNLLQKASEGDSMSVLGKVSELEANMWFAPIEMGVDSSVVRLELELNEVLTAEEILQIRAEERAANDQELLELTRMKRALDSLSLDKSYEADGIYFATILEGTGKAPTSGSEVTVHYRTYLSNGKRIDDTYEAEPLQYIVGKPDQVLPGFAIAMTKMREGQQALFLIPAELAYGSKGSSSGIVPPYAAIIYEAELVRVR